MKGHHGHECRATTTKTYRSLCRHDPMLHLISKII
jgi:hypothetical protein